MAIAAQPTVARPDQIEASGAVLGRAFFDDPMFVHILPDDGKRGAQNTWFFTTAARYGHRYGDMYTTGDEVAGNAIWLRPGEAKVPATRMLRAGLWQAPAKIGLGALNRFMTVMNFFEKLHEEDIPDRHWYLMVLGVDPPNQGQGIGGGLIAPMLARADSDSLPCYLETAKERNVAFYTRHGFEVVREGDTPNNGFHFWTMQRSPR